ncbi:hypothetical protein BC834DRAFT_974509 [Gloeopeniophorella convolvens]|nr:hypothetical protein BC834DRAFT_974509 [Gloeopeniophorella convolvens]
MLHIAILDTTGILYSIAKFAGRRDPTTLDPDRSATYCIGAFSISMSALMGTHPVPAFVESTIRISNMHHGDDDRPRFFVLVFFSPIFTIIPFWATGRGLAFWDYNGAAVPAYLTMIIILLTCNVAYGMIAGIVSYIPPNTAPWLLRKATNGCVVPPGYAQAEPWVIPPGGIIPAWVWALYCHQTSVQLTHPSLHGIRA